MNLIRDSLQHALRPIVLWSGGKDSTVLLHLCLRIQKLPVLHFRFPKWPEKHSHAHRVMLQWDLEAHDLLPDGCLEFQDGDYFEVFHLYNVGNQDRLILSSGLAPYEAGRGRYLCAVDDLLMRPKGACAYPWDVTFHGHKSCDRLEFAGAARTVEPVSQLGHTALVCPLADWTDDEIWTYIHQYHLPYDRSRYDRDDHSRNPDHYPTCFACLDTRLRGQSVHCPKLNRPIENIAKDPAYYEQLKAELLQAGAYCHG